MITPFFLRVALFALCFLLPAVAVFAEDPAGAFLRGYTEFQNGEKLEASGDSAQALAKFRLAAGILEKISRSNPEWQPLVVQYRLKKITEAIGRAEANPASRQPTPPPGKRPGAGASAAQPVGGQFYEGDLPRQDVQQRGQRPLPQEDPRLYPPGRQEVLSRQQQVPPSRASSDSSPEAARLREENQALREQLGQKAVELKNALREVDKTRVSVVELRHDLAQTKTRLADALKDRGSVEKLRADFAKQIAELSGVYEKARAERDVLEEENDRLQAKLEQAAAYITASDDIRKTLESERKTFHEARESARIDRDKVQSELDGALAEVKDSRERLSELQVLAAENQTLKKALAASEDAVVSLESKIKENEQSITGLKDRLAGAVSPDVLENTKRELNREIAQKEEANRALLAEKEKLASDLQDTRRSLGSLAALEKEKSDLAEELAGLKKRETELAEGVKAAQGFQGEQAKLQFSLARMQKELDAAKGEREKLQVELAAAKKAPVPASAPKAEKEKAEMAEKLAALQKREAELSEALKQANEKGKGESEVQAALEVALKDLAKAKEENAELEKRLAVVAVPETSAELNEKLALAEKRVAEMEVQIQASKAEAEKKIAEAKLQSPAIQSNDAVVLSLQTEVNAVNDRLAVMRNQLAARDDRIATLEKQLDDTAAELTELRLNAKDKASGDALIENELLRGILLRELKEQARRQQAKRLIEDEIKTLAVQSDSLTENLKQLGSGFELTDEERSRFRLPLVLENEKTSPDSMSASVSFVKPSGGGSAPQGFEMLSKDSLALCKNAQKAFEKGNLAEAEQSFFAVLKTSPDNYYVLSQLAATQFQAGKTRAAEIALNRALELKPDDPFSLSTLGVVLYRQGKLADAESSLRRSIALEPKQARSYNYLGIVLSNNGDSKEAETMLQKAIKIDPKYAEAHFNLAVVYASQNPPATELARKHYRSAVSMGAAPDASLERILR